VDECKPLTTGAMYGNQSHRENIVPMHNGGEGLHFSQRVALCTRQGLSDIGAELVIICPFCRGSISVPSTI